MKTTALLAVLVIVTFVGGCTTGARMDYGTPAAQFTQEDVLEKGTAYVGTKITVKGMVEGIDITDPANAWLHLDGGIRCNFRTLKAMVVSCKVGDSVYVDGILKRCKDDGVLIEPALLRDSAASFEPK